MLGMTLLQVRNLARRMAEKRGHRIKRWNSRHPLRYTAICDKCRAGVAVFSERADLGAWPNFTDKGMIVARDRESYRSGRDYNWAQGERRRRRCV
jgi:hypothetical protein